MNMYQKSMFLSFRKNLPFLKLKAMPKLLIPCVFGQWVGFASKVNNEGFLWLSLLLGITLTVLNLYYILLLNDYADIHVDLIKKKDYKTAGIKFLSYIDVFSKEKTLYLGCCCGFFFFLISMLAHVFLSFDYLIYLSLLSLLLLFLYSYYPFKLNYRGGGEILEAFGVGIVIPWINAYLQSHEILNINYVFFYLASV